LLPESKIPQLEDCMKKLLFGLLLCLVTVANIAPGNAKSGSQDKMSQASSQKHAPDGTKQTNLDACALLTSADVQAIQGEPVQQTVPSSQPGGGLKMWQCLFRTAVPSKSVSVSVASPLSISPRGFWQKQFHDGRPAERETEKTEKKSGGRKEEEEGGTRPRSVTGVGEEAYWVGGPMVGALYVLKGKTFLRISVGGVREESERIKKSIALARLALKRLQAGI